MTDAQSIASALGEARECADCEALQPERRRSSWRDLPVDERTSAPDDFAVRRGALGPDDVLDWSLLAGLAGPPMWVPSDAIDIDYTRPHHPSVLCATDGQATAKSVDQAVARALLERIERDAVVRHRMLASGERRAWAIDPNSVPLDWFQAHLKRTAELQMFVKVDRLPTIGNLPAYQLSITEADKPGAPCRFAGGWAAAFTTAAALESAMLEAAQSRVGHIAGARDDIGLHPEPPTPQPSWLASTARRPFLLAGEEPADDAEAVRRLCDLLAAAGFPRIGYVIASAEGAAYVTVKCFVPGLAQNERTARPVSGTV